MDGQLTPAELEQLADEFWDGFDGPGELRKAANRYCLIFEIRDLSYFRLKAWYDSVLPEMSEKVLLPLKDRKLHGFFDCGKEKGLLFLDKDDEPPEQNFSLAHELSHFLIEYDRHRKKAIEAMGAEKAAKFLEQRTTTNERTKGLLHGVSFGPFPHFLEMDRQSGFHRYGIGVAERNADLLARELLAPRRELREVIAAKRFHLAKAEAFQALTRKFQLPKKQAEAYAYDLAEELTGGPSFDDFLEGKGRETELKTDRENMIQEKMKNEHEPPISSPGNVPLEKAIVEALDMEKWSSGPDLEGLYQRLEKETREATLKEIEGWETLKREVIPRIEENNHAAGIPCNQLTQVEDSDLRRIHCGILFNGGVEAITGTLSLHQSLPLSVSQIGLCMVSYQGEMGTYSHRIFKKDLQTSGEKPKEAVFRAMNQRMDNRGRENTEKQFSELAQRGLKAYSERAMLLGKSNANWLMGQGNPFPLEMLTDYWAKVPGLLDKSLEVLNKLVEHQRFIYVPRQPNLPAWLTLGHALEPLQFLVIGTLQGSLQSAIRKTEVSKADRKHLEQFIAEHGPKVVYGVFRTSFLAGPQMFYAHIDHIYTAVHIAMADSVLQEHRGYPMLLDIGRSICQATFNQKSFETLVQQAYAKAGNPYRYNSNTY